MELDLSLDQNLDASSASSSFLKQQIKFFSYFHESTNIPISTYV